MKAETIIKKIISENQCSIATAELLDRALKREKHLPSNVWLRFRPMFGDFDVIDVNIYDDSCDFSNISRQIKVNIETLITEIDAEFNL